MIDVKKSRLPTVNEMRKSSSVSKKNIKEDSKSEKDESSEPSETESSSDEETTDHSTVSEPSREYQVDSTQFEERAKKFLADMSTDGRKELLTQQGYTINKDGFCVLKESESPAPKEHPLAQGAVQRAKNKIERKQKGEKRKEKENGIGHEATAVTNHLEVIEDDQSCEIKEDKLSVHRSQSSASSASKESLQQSSSIAEDVTEEHKEGKHSVRAADSIDNFREDSPNTIIKERYQRLMARMTNTGNGLLEMDNMETMVIRVKHDLTYTDMPIIDEETCENKPPGLSSVGNKRLHYQGDEWVTVYEKEMYPSDMDWKAYEEGGKCARSNFQKPNSVFNQSAVPYMSNNLHEAYKPTVDQAIKAVLRDREHVDSGFFNNHEVMITEVTEAGDSHPIAKLASTTKSPVITYELTTEDNNSNHLGTGSGQSHDRNAIGDSLHANETFTKTLTPVSTKMQHSLHGRLETGDTCLHEKSPKLQKVVSKSINNCTGARNANAFTSKQSVNLQKDKSITIGNKEQNSSSNKKNAAIPIAQSHIFVAPVVSSPTSTDDSDDQSTDDQSAESIKMTQIRKLVDQKLAGHALKNSKITNARKPADNYVGSKNIKHGFNVKEGDKNEKASELPYLVTGSKISADKKFQGYKTAKSHSNHHVDIAKKIHSPRFQALTNNKTCVDLRTKITAAKHSRDHCRQPSKSAASTSDTNGSQSINMIRNSRTYLKKSSLEEKKNKNAGRLEKNDLNRKKSEKNNEESKHYKKVIKRQLKNTKGKSSNDRFSIETYRSEHLPSIKLSSTKAIRERNELRKAEEKLPTIAAANKTNRIIEKAQVLNDKKCIVYVTKPKNIHLKHIGKTHDGNSKESFLPPVSNITNNVTREKLSAKFRAVKKTDKTETQKKVSNEKNSNQNNVKLKKDRQFKLASNEINPSTADAKQRVQQRSSETAQNRKENVANIDVSNSVTEKPKSKNSVDTKMKKIYYKVEEEIKQEIETQLRHMKALNSNPKPDNVCKPKSLTAHENASMKTKTDVLDNLEVDGELDENAFLSNLASEGQLSMYGHSKNTPLIRKIGPSKMDSIKDKVSATGGVKTGNKITKLTVGDKKNFSAEKHSYSAIRDKALNKAKQQAALESTSDDYSEDEVDQATANLNESSNAYVYHSKITCTASEVSIEKNGKCKNRRHDINSRQDLLPDGESSSSELLERCAIDVLILNESSYARREKNRYVLNSLVCMDKSNDVQLMREATDINANNSVPASDNEDNVYDPADVFYFVEQESNKMYFLSSLDSSRDCLECKKSLGHVSRIPVRVVNFHNRRVNNNLIHSASPKSRCNQIDRTPHKIVVIIKNKQGVNMGEAEATINFTCELTGTSKLEKCSPARQENFPRETHGDSTIPEHPEESPRGRAAVPLSERLKKYQKSGPRNIHSGTVYKNVYAQPKRLISSKHFQTSPTNAGRHSGGSNKTRQILKVKHKSACGEAEHHPQDRKRSLSVQDCDVLTTPEQGHPSNTPNRFIQRKGSAQKSQYKPLSRPDPSAEGDINPANLICQCELFSSVDVSEKRHMTCFNQSNKFENPSRQGTARSQATLDEEEGLIYNHGKVRVNCSSHLKSRLNSRHSLPCELTPESCLQAHMLAAERKASKPKVNRQATFSRNSCNAEVYQSHSHSNNVSNNKNESDQYFYNEEMRESNGDDTLSETERDNETLEKCDNERLGNGSESRSQSEITATEQQTTEDENNDMPKTGLLQLIRKKVEHHYCEKSRKQRSNVNVEDSISVYGSLETDTPELSTIDELGLHEHSEPVTHNDNVSSSVYELGFSIPKKNSSVHSSHELTQENLNIERDSINDNKNNDIVDTSDSRTKKLEKTANCASNNDNCYGAQSSQLNGAKVSLSQEYNKKCRKSAIKKSCISLVPTPAAHSPVMSRQVKRPKGNTFEPLEFTSNESSKVANGNHPKNETGNESNTQTTAAQKTASIFDSFSTTRKSAAAISISGANEDIHCSRQAKGPEENCEDATTLDDCRASDNISASLGFGITTRNSFVLDIGSFPLHSQPTAPSTGRQSEASCDSTNRSEVIANIKPPDAEFVSPGIASNRTKTSKGGGKKNHEATSSKNRNTNSGQRQDTLPPLSKRQTGLPHRPKLKRYY